MNNRNLLGAYDGNFGERVPEKEIPGFDSGRNCESLKVLSLKSSFMATIKFYGYGAFTVNKSDLKFE